MARTAQKVYDDIVAAAVTEYAAAGVTLVPANWSKYSPRRLTYWVIANAISAMEVLFDEARTVLLGITKTQKAHTYGWYATKAKEFQYGATLPAGSDTYDNTGLTQSAIDAMKVVKFCSAVPAAYGIRLKIAGIDGSGNLTPIGTAEFNAFKAYMNRVKDAGVFLNDYFKNQVADNLQLHLKIYYDPLVLDATGKRLDGTNDTPVQDAVTNYIKSIDFDGRYRLDKQTDALQAVDGVVTPEIVSAKAKYAALPYSDIITEYNPDAGHLKIYSPSDLTIDFIAYV